MQFAGVKGRKSSGEGSDMIHQVDDIEVRPEVERSLERRVKTIAPGIAGQRSLRFRFMAFWRKTLE